MQFDFLLRLARNQSQPPMTTPNRIWYASLSLATFLICGIPATYGQTPSGPASFNDSVSIFRETSTSDWPAVFLSPVPFNPQATGLEGVTLSVRKEYGYIGTIFSTTSEDAYFTWQTSSGGFTITNSGFGFDNGIHSVGFEANDGVLYVDGYNVLTQASLLAPIHFSQISLGAGSNTIGANSFAAGSGVTASGLNSGAFGLGTTAQGYNQFVIGQYNSPQGTGTANANATDALFIVGNGTSATAKKNALVVKRNGDTEIRGKLTAGIGASATGLGGLALGESALAYGGNNGTAIGDGAQAYGDGSAAFGFSAIAADHRSFAVGVDSIANAYASVALGSGAYAEAPNSSALGGGASAYGEFSSAVGIGAVAFGSQSFAAGPDSYANGFSSVALGTGLANGAYSTAMPAAEANGNVSGAMGDGSRTEGFSSIALGRDVIAQGLNQIAVGQFNLASGTPHNNWSEVNAWDPNDEIFIVGNGQSNSTRSNALTIKKNASTGIGAGIVTTTASQTVVGKYNDSSVGGLFVVGMGPGTGTEPRKNALRVREDGTLLVRPAGDLSMGDFHTGDQP
jgi:hypothetical protein